MIGSDVVSFNKSKMQLLSCKSCEHTINSFDLEIVIGHAACITKLKQQQTKENLTHGNTK